MGKSKNSLITPCHYGNVLVFEDPFKCYGGGWSRGFHVVKDSIILDLADVVAEPKVLFWNMEIPRSLNTRYTSDASVIRIRWPDGSIPELKPSFFHNLAEYLVLQNKTVVICCMGGHGRTGTLLAILAGIYGIHGSADLGEYIRARHCKHAIETYSQVDYIEEVTGFKTSIVPSWAGLNNWNRKSETYSATPVKECSECGNLLYMESTESCFKCKSTDLIDLTGRGNDNKVLGWFDYNDVYHTGYPREEDNASILVGQDEQGNDVFEYIYDKESDDFLPSR